MKTLRYYDEIELFKPIEVDPKSGYRYYCTDQFEQLNTINYLKVLGMPLKVIKAHLETRDIGHILELLEFQKEATQARIEELQKINEKIENRIDHIKYARDFSDIGVVLEKNLKARKVLFLKNRIKSNAELELAIRELENTSNNSSSIFIGKVGLTVSQENLKKKIFNEYDSIFITLEGDENGGGVVKTLPEGRYVCISFQGSHTESGAYYLKALKYIEEKNYKLFGEAVEITLIDFALTKNKKEYLTEVQIRVK